MTHPDHAPPALVLDASQVKAVIIGSRFNAHIVDALVSAAYTELKRLGCPDENISIVRTAGAWELPVLAAHFAEKNNIDIIIACACLIEGETAHFHYVANECCRALMDLSVTHKKAIANAVLTTHTEAQALARAGGEHGNKGAEAVQAALETHVVIQKYLEVQP
jgi:6,7-dimethyl-8-ribityllumazine synthase